ncbi:MAG: glycosyltransferase family 2 protein [Acidobacteriia bacterium]|nr:glycosyltransferase family 2 protein [Terriglobia bacterium]
MKAGAVVVNFNGGEDLPVCLAALCAQTMAVDVVLVDCASTDGSLGLVERPPAGVRSVPLAENAGYAGGCAAGLAAVEPEADVVGFFNPDCFPAPDFFAVCCELLARRPDAGGVAARLLRPGGEVLDSCGQILTPLLLRVRDRGYGARAAGRFAQADTVLAACGAAMLYRRTALEAAVVGGDVFPLEYFAFWEDLDLGWRVSNAGWPVLYEPRAIATHRRSATATPGSGRLIFRRTPALAASILVNRWATLLRNLHPVDFWLRLPVLLPGEVAMLAWVLLRRPLVLGELRRAWPRARRAVAQRRHIPRRRLSELL